MIANSQLAFARVPGKQTVSCMRTDGSKCVFATCKASAKYVRGNGDECIRAAKAKLPECFRHHMLSTFLQKKTVTAVAHAKAKVEGQNMTL